MRPAAIILLCCLPLFASCGWFGDDTPPLEEGFSYLFNGEDLEGWYPIGGNASFEVDDGDIVGTHGPGENTFLRTRAEFADFVLKLQVKFDEPGNSGILFRAQQRGEDGRAYGYQYELDSSERSWSGGIYDEARRQWLYPLTDNHEARQAFKLDDWNDVVIEARGADIQTWINGVPAAHLVDALDLQGYIGLQVHAGGSGIIRWRNIRIQELGAHRWQREGIAELKAWRSETELALDKDTLIAPGLQMVRISSRRELSDHAVRFSLPTCGKATLKIRQNSQTGIGGLELLIADGQLTLRAQGQQEPLGETVFETRPETYQVDIAAIGDRATVTVNERLLGRADGLGLPERGKLVIEAQPCDGQLRIADLQWLDLRQPATEKLPYQTLDTEPAPVLSPEEALQTFRLPPGFNIELVAAEPLVEDPVAMAWDETGKLYVVEMRGFMPDAYGEGQQEPVGRVVVLEDSNGDGKMDTSEVFLDELVNPRAIAVVNEGVLVGEPPNLWLCRNSKEARYCDDKVRIASYGTGHAGSNIEHMENGLLLGLDNWIYNAMSNRRLKLVGDEVISGESTSRGQWGISQDNQGRLYYNNNSVFVIADLFPAEQMLVDGKLTRSTGIQSNLHSKDSGKDEVFSIRVNPGVNRAYLDGILRPDGRLASPTAVSGLAVYRGGKFPTEYDQDIFIPEPGANVVAHFRTREEGMDVFAEHMTYDDEQWGQREFLASTDERFRPVDARIGPDGALYIIDMYRGIIQENAFLTDELREQIFERELDKPLGKGRIWRISHTDFPLVHYAPPWAEASQQQLITALGSDNGWRRDTAQRLLGASKEAIPALRQVVAAAEGIGAIHALWALQAQSALDHDTLSKALAGEDEQLALQALRAEGGQLAVAELLQLLKSQPASAIQHQLVFNLAPYAGREDVQLALLGSLGAGDQAFINEAVLHAVRGQESSFLPLLLAADSWKQATPDKTALLQLMSANAYRSIRPELASEAPAPQALHELLSLTYQQSGAMTWRQLAMLRGFGKVAGSSGFKAVGMGDIPPIFNDASLQESSPLWQARLEARRAFTWPGDELAAGLKPLTPNQLAQLEKGKAFYAGCASCHGEDGQGKPGLAPPLVGTDWVTGPPEWLARIVLQGLSGPIEVAGKSWDGVMPGHQGQPGFDDDTAAGLLTYLRRSWGNAADPVGKDTIVAVREETADRTTPWTAQELRTVPFRSGLEKYAGKYKVSFVTFTITEHKGTLQIEVPMYGTGELVHQADTAFIADPGGQNIPIEFDVAPDNTVTALLLERDGERIRVEKVE